MNTHKITLFRIGAAEHINDISGTGAKLFGGRWNFTGYPVLYTSSSISLAMLEFLVHVPMALAPANLRIIEINISAPVKRKSIENNQLPSNWRDYPAPDKLAALGTDWLKAKSSLLLDVPSAIVARETNILINPLHHDIKLVQLQKPEKISFDERFFK